MNDILVIVGLLIMLAGFQVYNWSHASRPGAGWWANHGPFVILSALSWGLAVLLAAIVLGP